VDITSGKDHVMLGTKSGLAVRFEEGEVRPMGRPAGGVTGVRFKREADEVVGMIVVPDGDQPGLQGPHRAASTATASAPRWKITP
jgi:DNA gyrase subunit A